MNWFEKLTGFTEKSPKQVKENLYVENGKLISKVNQKAYSIGKFEVVSLQDLKAKTSLKKYKSNIKISQIVGDVQGLHQDILNQNALFQVASQFNVLEMTAPHITPELGVTRYQMDYTQGPACAIACGAGAIYRNYFVDVNGRKGQSATNQIDCLNQIGAYFNNDELDLWDMQNGYAMLGQDGLLHLNKAIRQLTDKQYNEVKSKLEVGIQWGSEVTISNKNQIVSQIFCSALPVAYGDVESIYWEKFARLILEATYEATLYAGLLNYEKTKCKKVYLTMIGGGVFGNQQEWILDAMKNAIKQFKNTPLEVVLVSYRDKNYFFEEIIYEM